MGSGHWVEDGEVARVGERECQDRLATDAFMDGMKVEAGLDACILIRLSTNNDNKIITTAAWYTITPHVNHLSLIHI